jgi:hypothetical protein
VADDPRHGLHDRAVTPINSHRIHSISRTSTRDPGSVTMARRLDEVDAAALPLQHGNNPLGHTSPSARSGRIRDEKNAAH